MRNRLRLIIALAAVLALGSTVAIGYVTAVTTPGSSDPKATTGTLPVPAAPAQPTLTGADVTVSWPAASVAGQTLDYVVKRYTSGAGTVVACTTTTSGNTVTCLDKGAPSGTHTYRVAAKLNNWTGAESAASPQVTVPGPAKAATVTGVSTSTESGSYRAGTTITFAVTFSDPVTVTGTPQLALNVGRAANYAAGSGTRTLSFDYIVAAGDSANDLDYASATALTLNAGTIRDAAGTAADLSLAAPGAIAAAKDIVIDTTAPAGLTFSASAGGGNSANLSGQAGRAAGDNRTIGVVVCKVNAFPCTAANTEYSSTTVAVNQTTGAWGPVNTGNIGKGTHYVRVTQSDAAGNLAAVTTSFAL